MQKPILKPRPRHNSIISIAPQPPQEHRPIPADLRAKITRNRPHRGQKLPINQAIDYDKLTPLQQIKWDAGIFGSIQLRQDVKRPYYFTRWKDPTTGAHRSTKLGHTPDEAIAKLRELTCDASVTIPSLPGNRDKVKC